MMRLAVAVDIKHSASDRVIDAAIVWATRAGASLDILYVEAPQYKISWLSDPTARELVRREIEQHRGREASQLAELISRIPEAGRGVARTLQGPPVEALVQAGDAYDALLLATHGRSGIQHFWLGSVVEGVVRKARTTVIALRIPAVPQ